MPETSPVRIIKQPNMRFPYCVYTTPQIARFEDVLHYKRCAYQREDKILGNYVCTDYRNPCACNNRYKRIMTV